MLTALMAMCTVGTYTVAYFIFKKKYIIDEAYFEKITARLEQREQEANSEQVSAES